jgi:hypothetical protein
MNKNISLIKFVRILPSFLLLFLFQCAETESPKDVVKNFYTSHLKTNASGLPDEKDLETLKPFLTSKLNSMFVKALDEQNNFIKKYPGEKPPLIEGDLFSSFFEGPTTFNIADSKMKNDSAIVYVNFTYSDSLNSDKPFKWHDAVDLILENGKWKICDIEYLGDWDFAPKGRLSEIIDYNN